MAETNEDPMATIERLVRVTNAHDLEGLVACFADEYVLDSPIHPQRSFRGKEQVRRNWTQFFAGVPDITTKVLRHAVSGDVVWTEWEMTGTRVDKAAHRVCGVFIFGVTGGLVRWGRMFLDPVEGA